MLAAHDSIIQGDPTETLVCYLQCPSTDIAIEIAEQLYDSHLISSFKVYNQTKTVREYKNELSTGPETICMVKTKRALYEKMVTKVKALSPLY